MAIRPFPKNTALEKVPLSQSESYPRLKCSATSQDSKAENSRLVEMPPNILPSIKTQKFGECLVMQEAMYVATYNSDAFRRPLGGGEGGKDESAIY